MWPISPYHFCFTCNDTTVTKSFIMKLRLWLVCLGCLFAAFIAVPRAAAQQSVTCESNDGNRRYCGRYAPDQVVLQRQVSSSACVRDRSWGVDRQGLWVDRGCRAIFAVRNYGYPDGPGAGPGPVPPSGGRPTWAHPGSGDRWPPSGNWNGGNWERGGACFYKGPNFSGDYFCTRRGESLPSLGDY